MELAADVVDELLGLHGAQRSGAVQCPHGTQVTVGPPAGVQSAAGSSRILGYRTGHQILSIGPGDQWLRHAASSIALVISVGASRFMYGPLPAEQDDSAGRHYLSSY
jgi:hypothetical protein